MVRIVHFVCVGEEDASRHLAGIAKYAAHEAVLFTAKKSGWCVELQGKISELGMVSRLIEVRDNYADTFARASEEVNGFIAGDVCLALNLATGSRVMLAALEDAVRSQLATFHSPSEYRSGPVCSAFRYIVESSRAREAKVRMMPIWNTSSSFHNAVISSMLDRGDYLSIQELWASVDQLETYPISHDGFRKMFRALMNWIANLPCLKQKVKRGQRFRLELE